MSKLKGDLDLTVSTGTFSLSTGVTVAKNSAALTVVAILTKGGGLIVAVLVARYLGPAALGTYAAVMGLSLLLENIAPLGQPFLIIRQLARDRTNLLRSWLNTSLVTLLFSLVLGLALVVIIRQVVDNGEYRTSAYYVALYLPISGLYAIAQAAVQGLERMENLTISALIGRTAGLLVLWLLLRSGMGVAAAFIGYGVFQLVAMLILVWGILKQAGQTEAIRGVRPDLLQCWTSLRLSVPFAIQNLLRSALLQISVLVLPFLVAMKTVGMFDAADRVPQTSVMIIPIITSAILPTLARTTITERKKAAALSETAFKMLQIVILPFVFFVAVAADQIIPLLYGSGYEAAVPVLRILTWAQIFFVADAVLIQIMMASDHEAPMVRRTALSLGVNVVLLLLLAPRYGAIAAAWAVVATRALNWALDAHFVIKYITPINMIGIVRKPLLCAALSGGVGLIAHGYGLWISLLLFIITYFILLWITRVFNANELLLGRQISAQLWQKLVSLREQLF